MERSFTSIFCYVSHIMAIIMTKVSSTIYAWYFLCTISILNFIYLSHHVSVCAGAGLTRAPTPQCSSFQCARLWCWISSSYATFWECFSLNCGPVLASDPRVLRAPCFRSVAISYFRLTSFNVMTLDLFCVEQARNFHRLLLEAT